MHTSINHITCESDLDSDKAVATKTSPVTFSTRALFVTEMPPRAGCNSCAVLVYLATCLVGLDLLASLD